MGLVNAVVPADELDEEVDKWCAEIWREEPDGDRHRQALVQRRQREHSRHRRLGLQALALFYDTEESKEGVARLQRKAQAGLP